MTIDKRLLLCGNTGSPAQIIESIRANDARLMYYVFKTRNKSFRLQIAALNTVLKEDGHIVGVASTYDNALKIVLKIVSELI